MKRINDYYLLAVLIVVIHFILLMHYFEPAISTPDAQGYFTQAKLITTTSRTSYQPESGLSYIGPHWSPALVDEYYTTFPPGFPVMLAVLYKPFGARAAFYLNPVLASLSLLGLFLIVRLWIGDFWGVLAVLLFAANSIANEHALFGDSHTSVIFFLIYGLFFLTVWQKKKTMWSIFLAGLCFGMIPTIRYAETLILLAFAIFLLINFEKSKFYYTSLASGIIGAGIPIVALALRNQITFGAFWKTGYGLTDEPAHFGFNYFLDHFVPYIAQLMFEGLGILFITGLIGIGVMIRKKEFQKLGILYLLIILPLTFLYMAYVWAPDPQSMRFLLPSFPIYILATVWLLKIITARKKRAGIVSTLIVVLLTLTIGFPRSAFSLHHLKIKNSVLDKIATVVEKQVPKESIVIAKEGILQNLDVFGKWKLSDISMLIPQSVPPSFSDEIHHFHTHQIRNVQASEKYTNLPEDDLFTTVKKNLRDWSGERSKIYLLLKEEQLDRLHSRLSGRDSLLVQQRINIPDSRAFSIHPGKNRGMPGQGMKGTPGNSSHRMMQPNQIYDFFIDGKPIFLVEWVFRE